MYGYITLDGEVGELFSKKPAPECYEASFLSRVIKLPKGVTTGWKYEDGQWIDPREANLERESQYAREERGRLLNECDTVYCNASNWENLTAAEKAAWQAYKQALRDLPEQEGFPYEATWPKRPKQPKKGV